MAIQEGYKTTFGAEEMLDSKFKAALKPDELIDKNGGAGPWRLLHPGETTEKGNVHIIGEVQIVPVRLYGNVPQITEDSSLASAEFNLTA